jgi:hypothetical protein
MRDLLNAGQVLGRSEMKKIMAGSGGSVFIRCCSCQNSTCEGYADDCVTGGYQICGTGYPGQGGPCFTCYP